MQDKEEDRGQQGGCGHRCLCHLTPCTCRHVSSHGYDWYAATEKWSCRGGGFSIWGFGSSVLENVTQNATSFVSTIVETDWNKEFQEIQDGLKEDTQTLEHEVEKKLGISNAKGESATAREGAPKQAGEAPGFISDFGRRLVHGTTEIFQQVRQHVDAEFTSLEQEAAKKPRSTFPKRTGAGKFSRFDFQAYDEEARQAEAEQILSSNAFMADLHSRLVPLVISDDTFWHRYFFRVNLLKSEHEKRDQRLRQAHRCAGSEAGEVPLDDPFDDSDDARPPEAAESSVPAPAAEATPSPPEPASPTPQATPRSPPCEAPAAPSESPAADGQTERRSEADQALEAAEPAVHTEAAGSVASAGSELPGASQRASDAAETRGLCGGPPAADTAEVAAKGATAAAESLGKVAGADGASPDVDDAALVHAAEAVTEAADVLAGVGVAAAAGADAALQAKVEPSGEGEEHASGSSAAGSAARSPQSSGNVMSSEWSIVSGTQAGGAGMPGHGNGVLKEHVPAVEEVEEGVEEIDVQEEDVNFDDLDSLGGDVDGEGDDDEEIDENWGQWE